MHRPFVDLQEGRTIEPFVRELQAAIDEQVFDSRVIVRQLEQGPPFDAPLEVRVVGPELATLGRLGNELRLLLSQDPQVIHTRSDAGESIPKAVVGTGSSRGRKSWAVGDPVCRPTVYHIGWCSGRQNFRWQ